MPMDWDEFKSRKQGGGMGPPQIKLPEFRMPNMKLPGALIVVIAIALWLLSGIYTVGPDEQGIVLRYGAMNRVTSSGLNYHIPFPIERVYTPKVTEVKRIELGFRTIDPGPPARYSDKPNESRMLTGDENMVDLDVIVQYRISDAAKYLFNVRNPQTTVGHAAEAAVRQVVGSKPIDEALTTGKGVIQQQTLGEIQNILNKYDSGLTVVAVQLQDVTPPKEVIQSFKDVASAREDQNRLINEAQGYQNQIIPEARGKRAQILRRAEAYRETKIRQARGDANRFLATVREYKKAPEITRKRLYLEMMKDVMPTVDKFILDGKNGSGVLPILSLRGDGLKEIKK
ncbi:MAG: FtsH protease activity modulator HflK [Nitrospinaceae bacterium]|jgi:modulator of FtsH protease HflK|nr:FtsH protease activity modulator HflK [Nitrospinaceae bacterium]MBT3434052.1 FtsH protease activity modulator HflK [Nitrospinaceae bacterium]MBT3820283.1 FtsH protease activity modulator HflK [Nitrospinaceae bacterium]MBT4092375.1 FtsH protease activity modulator HflK [Nitrospinaceae bacterium]MBT4428984.1 FtsH protease activity modulator HflK [Nitrospinaceae bacterium]